MKLKCLIVLLVYSFTCNAQNGTIYKLDPRTFSDNKSHYSTTLTALT
jgi:hypothetical protein